MSEDSSHRTMQRIAVCVTSVFLLVSMCWEAGKTQRHGLRHNKLTPATTQRLELRHNTLTPARLGLRHNTLTPARTQG